MASLGVPSFQQPLGELHATAGLVDVLLPVLGDGVAPVDAVGRATGLGLVLEVVLVVFPAPGQGKIIVSPVDPKGQPLWMGSL